MIVVATFIGTDGSLGYKHGVQYRLRVSQFNNQSIIVYRDDEEKSGQNKYLSLAAFLKNWGSVSYQHA